MKQEDDQTRDHEVETKESLPPLFEQFDEIYPFWSYDQLLEIGYRLHVAMLDKAAAWANGEVWAWKEADVLPVLDRIGDAFTPSIAAYDDTFLISWNEDDVYLTVDDLRSQMADALNWTQIDSMRRTAKLPSAASK